MADRLPFSGSFMYEHTDIPEGMTLAEYRSRRAAGGRRRRWRRLRAALARLIDRERRRRSGGAFPPRPLADPRRLGPAG